MKMREAGRPWELGKAFDESAPIGPVYRAQDVGSISDAQIWLELDGVQKQRRTTAKLIWSVAETISYLSRYFKLEPGDARKSVGKGKGGSVRVEARGCGHH